MMFDAQGIPDGVVDIGSANDEINALYCVLVDNLAADGDDIAHTISKAVADAGPAGGLLAVNVCIRLMKHAVMPLMFELGATGMPTEDIWALIQPN